MWQGDLLLIQMTILIISSIAIVQRCKDIGINNDEYVCR